MSSRTYITTDAAPTIPSSTINSVSRQEEKKFGLVLIFNFNEFEEDDEERLGSEKDVQMIRETFKLLGILDTNIHVHRDRTAEEIKRILFRVHTKGSEASNIKFLIIFVMSHGIEGDIIITRSGNFKLRDMLESLNSIGLADVMKWFTIVACKKTKHTMELSDEIVYRKTQRLPHNTLVYFSTTEGSFSYRDPMEGTWLVQQLCFNLYQYGRKEDIVKILTRTNNSIRCHFNNEVHERQTPVIVTSLGNKFYLDQYSYPVTPLSIRGKGQYEKQLVFFNLKIVNLLVVIFYCEEFKKHIQPLKDVFMEHCVYKVLDKQFRNKDVVLDTIEEVLHDKTSNDGIFIVILGHKHMIREDFLYSDDRKTGVLYKDVWKPFLHAPQMNGLPKIFLFQTYNTKNLRADACRTSLETPYSNVLLISRSGVDSQDTFLAQFSRDIEKFSHAIDILGIATTATKAHKPHIVSTLTNCLFFSSPTNRPPTFSDDQLTDEVDNLSSTILAEKRSDHGTTIEEYQTFVNSQNTICLPIDTQNDNLSTIILVGSKRSGKSTLINSVANYLMSNTFIHAKHAPSKLKSPIGIHFKAKNDKKKVVDVIENALIGDSKISALSTQTSDAHCFDINGEKSVRFVDTPPLDEDLNKAEENINNLLLYVNRFPILHGIGIVMRADSVINKKHFEKFIGKLKMQFGAEIMRNIFFVLTKTTEIGNNEFETLQEMQEIVDEVNRTGVEIKLNYDSDEDRNVFCFDNTGYKYLIALKKNIKYHNKEIDEIYNWKMSCQSAWDMLHYVNGHGQKAGLIPIPAKTVVGKFTGLEYILKLDIQSPGGSYTWASKPEGILIIFNFSDFSGLSFEERDGSQEDVKNLAKTFSNINFEYVVYENLTKANIAEKLKQANNYLNGEKERGRVFNMLVTFFMTHGTTGDKVYAIDEPIDISYITKAFSEHHGIPKMFAFVACKGRDMAQTSQYEIVHNKTMSSPKDTVLYYSTAEHQVSYRNKFTGTWLIQELCKNISEQACRKHLLQILITTNDSIKSHFINESGERKVQTPVIVTSLTKQFYLCANNVTADENSLIRYNVQPENFIVVIFHGEEFKADARILHETFTESCQFVVFQYPFAFQHEFKKHCKIVIKYIQSSYKKNKEVGLFVVVLGRFNPKRYDSLRTDDNEDEIGIPYKDIWKQFLFLDELLTMPKLFMLQSYATRTATDSREKTKKDMDLARPDADFLLISRSNVQHGDTFVAVLCDTIRTSGDESDIIQIASTAARTNPPQIVCTFTKFFYPKLSSSFSSVEIDDE